MDVWITVALVALVFWAVALGAVTFARALVNLASCEASRGCSWSSRGG
jgi:hypothetical protein